MIAKILNLLKQLSENELKELFEIIQRRYAVESKFEISSSHDMPIRISGRCKTCLNKIARDKKDEK